MLDSDSIVLEKCMNFVSEKVWEPCKYIFIICLDCGDHMTLDYLLNISSGIGFVPTRLSAADYQVQDYFIQVSPTSDG